MIDHISLPVGDMDKAQDFYDAALGALGYRRIMDIADMNYRAAGYGMAGAEPPFWIGAAKGDVPYPVPQLGQHIAFRAGSRTAVDAFYAAALEAGGKDNGAPGLRPEYHPNYYAAFVIDASGNHIEAVCHSASG